MKSPARDRSGLQRQERCWCKSNIPAVRSLRRFRMDRSRKGPRLLGGRTRGARNASTRQNLAVLPEEMQTTTRRGIEPWFRQVREAAGPCQIDVGAPTGRPAWPARVFFLLMKTMDPPQQANPTKDEVVRLNVRGMSCASCVAAVEAALEKTPGVKEASVDLIGQRADVRVEAG